MPSMYRFRPRHTLLFVMFMLAPLLSSALDKYAGVDLFFKELYAVTIGVTINFILCLANLAWKNKYLTALTIVATVLQTALFFYLLQLSVKAFWALLLCMLELAMIASAKRERTSNRASS